VKILYVTDSFPPEGIGGAGQVVFDMAKGMIARGHDVHILSVTIHQENIGTTEYESIPVKRISSSEKSQFFRSYRAAYNPFIKNSFSEALKEINPDIVHFHNIHEHFSFTALRWASKTGAAVFITLHDTLSFSYTRLYHFIDPNDPHQQGPFNYHVSWKFSLQQVGKAFNPFRNWSIRRSLAHAHTIFSVSNALKDALEQNRIHNVTTLYNGIDCGEFTASEEETNALRSQLNLGNKKVILFGGRAMQDKGAEIIISTLPMIVKQCPDTVLVMATEQGGYQERLRSMARELGIEDVVVFTELFHGRERAALFSLASLVVVPSIYFDPAPLMVMQAMAAGKPVVGTCFGGTPEIIEDGKTGYVINPFNTQLLVDRTSELLHDPALAHEMGEAGKKRIFDHFLLEQQLDRVIAFYEKASLPQE